MGGKDILEKTFGQNEQLETYVNGLVVLVVTVFTNIINKHSNDLKFTLPQNKALNARISGAIGLNFFSHERQGNMPVLFFPVEAGAPPYLFSVSQAYCS